MSIKHTQKFIIAALVAAFCAIAPATGTFAVSSNSIVSGSGSSSSTSSSSGTSSSSTTGDSSSSIPDTSAGTTVSENPNTADETWLLALASLAVTAAALGGRHYFVKH